MPMSLSQQSVDNLQVGRPHLLAAKSRLLAKAADSFMASISDPNLGKGFLFKERRLSKIQASLVSPEGLMITGELIWQVRAFCPRNRRTRSITLHMPVIAGDPQKVASFRDSSGLEYPFSRDQLNKIMGVRDKTRPGKRRSNVMISYSG